MFEGGSELTERTLAIMIVYYLLCHTSNRNRDDFASVPELEPLRETRVILSALHGSNLE